ncbi:MAG: GH3 auxin-responsive promoter family protein [Dehalococcoidia bacterium]|nr:GH3 auxin-responsive promoter family protein [Dehalococcoidia bacterium]
MIRPIDLLRQGRKEELWQMCCGFTGLRLEQFMTIQKRLLLEQIGLLKNCELGKRVLGGVIPKTLEEFRELVPLTTYADYLPELVEQREDGLPAKTAMWVHSSGYTGRYDVKWVPMSDSFASEFEKVCGGIVILALCNGRGDVSKVKEPLQVLFTMGPRPYASGVIGEFVQRALGCDFLPSGATELSFTERIKAGFEQSLYRGLDGFGGLASVLVAVGEQLKQQSGNMNIRPLLKHPRALIRIVKGLVKSKRAHRSMLPKDLWNVKGIVGGGTDSAIFRKRVEELWGRSPLEVYGGAEGGIYATQTWDYEGMTFIPSLNFFEFIPERERFKWQLDHSYQPKTVLLDEVKAGENYEIVITNFHGGILTRFRVGDMVKVTSLQNEELDIDIPQMVFYSRADDLIIVTGLGYITERLVWEAIENTGIPYVDWTVRKETLDDNPTLHIYIETQNDYIVKEESAAASVREEFRKLEKVYNYNPYPLVGDLETVLDLKPIKVTLLPQGAFSSYISQREAEGADLGHLKPPHINPSDEVLSLLGAPKVVVEAMPASETERVPSR